MSWEQDKYFFFTCPLSAAVILFWYSYIFLFLNYQIISTEKILKFVLKKYFLEHAQSDE